MLDQHRSVIIPIFGRGRGKQRKEGACRDEVRVTMLHFPCDVGFNACHMLRLNGCAHLRSRRPRASARVHFQGCLAALHRAFGCQTATLINNQLAHGSRTLCRRLRYAGRGRNTSAAATEAALAEPVGSDPSESQARLPRHVAVIMDGNARWAKSRGLPVSCQRAALPLRTFCGSCKIHSCQLPLSVGHRRRSSGMREAWRRSGRQCSAAGAPRASPCFLSDSPACLAVLCIECLP